MWVSRVASTRGGRCVVRCRARLPRCNKPLAVQSFPDYNPAMLSVVIATFNDAERLAHSLSALVPAAAEGVVREVVVVDAGSTDDTARIADGTGCTLVRDDGPMGARLSAGARTAGRAPWLMFLRPGVVLEPRWEQETQSFLDRVSRSGQGDRVAAVFRHGRDGFGAGARVRAAAAGAASLLAGLPHASQPLMISREFYRRLGGHRPFAALEDVDLVRRIGRRRVVRLKSEATLVEGVDPTPPTAPRQGIGRALAVLPLPMDVLVRIHG